MCVRLLSPQLWTCLVGRYGQLSHRCADSTAFQSVTPPLDALAGAGAAACAVRRDGGTPGC
eukprot:scaffold1006_cov408-Prasinococcus_capsulatus_cf.AAC.27